MRCEDTVGDVDIRGVGRVRIREAMVTSEVLDVLGYWR